MNTALAFRCVSTVITLLVLCGCAAHEVRCDGRLEPINAPAPARHPAPDGDHEE